MSRGRKGFHPRMVPEIRNGYYYLAQDATGIGTTSFRVPEGNKHPTFDLIQATVANQPTLLNENGGIQFRMRKTGDVVGASIVATSGAVQAGWTGATYIGGWFRLPDVAGDITGLDGLFQHSASSPNRRAQLTLDSASDKVLNTMSSTGSNSLSTRWDTVVVGGGWTWIEWVFDPLFALGGSLAAERIKLFAGLVLQTRTQDAAGPTSISNGSSLLSVGCFTATANTDTTDWCSAYYGNGVPSLKNRKRLANYLNPSNVKFQV